MLFVRIFGNFQISTKFGTLDPLFIAEILKRIQEASMNIKNVILVDLSIFEHIGQGGVKHIETHAERSWSTRGRARDSRGPVF